MSSQADGRCEERRVQMQQQCEFILKVQHFFSPCCTTSLRLARVPPPLGRFDRKHEEVPLGQRDLKVLTGRK